MHLFVNDLTIIDFSYLDTQRGIVGESWIVDVALIGQLNEQNMVLDFGVVKSQIKRIIDREFDHKLHIAEDSTALVSKQMQQDNLDIVYKTDALEYIYMSAPPSAYCFLQAEQVNIDEVLPLIRATIMRHMPENVKDLEIRLRPEQINQAYYHYSHGLKKHDGNCQRIVHGHRSKVDVFKDGQVDTQWQEYWAKRWQDIYIGSEEDLDQNLLTEFCQQYSLLETDYVAFSYSATQGEYKLVCPNSLTDVIDRDTTVECLAEFMLEVMQQTDKHSNLKVMAYEGVSKGAIAQSE
ncbi:6-carboxytetrahydropterin synthase [Catenovulum sp. 2E275]|uniref:6-carboxytetrahydropterin synthase n=1 Tax=Catenovulum sp. 2E275 TaxID=2980497 RepID=UPI0021D1A951|nr:6-carboxytetrahydropterin synthase [Catenovulum sp. 2E275]MCU4676501.1 6-carboxytetrahydropterin synthase [Catenovulum sp. 2E275]